ncbi:unnamed protein product [Symbiodinium sp. CCMP2592]|nr:unnamed protein product [Symbiodinium sp. CCMP2592]
MSPIDHEDMEAVRGTRKGARFLHEAPVEDGVTAAVVKALSICSFEVALAQTSLTLLSVVFRALASFPTAMFLCVSHDVYVHVYVYVYVCVRVCLHASAYVYVYIHTSVIVWTFRQVFWQFSLRSPCEITSWVRAWSLGSGARGEWPSGFRAMGRGVLSCLRFKGTRPSHSKLNPEAFKP